MVLVGGVAGIGSAVVVGVVSFGMVTVGVGLAAAADVTSVGAGLVMVVVVVLSSSSKNFSVVAKCKE